MLFNSLAFVVFLGVVYPVWRACGPLLRRRWLLLASLFFYGWWDWRFLFLLLGSSALDYYSARRIEADRASGKRWVALSVAANLGVLGVFKYLGFFTIELARLMATLGVPDLTPIITPALPIGLSFYTFQTMAYTVDVYRGRTQACRDPLDFLLFISFFPQLVAGPIERSENLLPQLHAARSPTPTQLAEGAWLVLWGLLKKVLVADNLAPIVARGFDDSRPTAAAVAIAAYAFTWQIYCDFSGYTDIARGLGKWLGVELRTNFDLPFFAASPREIWRRWHISLSEWLRDYLYVPLGGNRSHADRNLIVTMLLGGLWHGANWTFLAWGAWHGLALALQRRVRLSLPRPVAVIATFHFMMFGFVLFRAHSIGHVVDLARAASALNWITADLAPARLLLVLCGPLLLLELWMERRRDPMAVLGLPRPIQAAVVAVGVLGLTLLGATYGTRFIYFQF